jgi:transcriptional antiterminator NusG
VTDENKDILTPQGELAEDRAETAPMEHAEAGGPPGVAWAGVEQPAEAAPAEAAPPVSEPVAQSIQPGDRAEEETQKAQAADAAGEPAAAAAESPPAEEADDMDVAPLEEVVPEEGEIRKEWYILKVQSNREDSIREGLLRRVKMEGLERYFGDVIVPTEMVTEFKGGKKKVVRRKLYPGYLVVNMQINDDTWYLVRETTGIGDFTGSIGRPTPMAPQDVQKILAKTEEKADETPKLDIRFKKGDRVKINEGTFENFEGDVDHIDEASGRATVMINIFGRSTPVELEHWQIEAI